MSGIKFLEIDTFSQEDTDAMFVALCKKACDIDPDEAKITVSGEKLDKKSVIGYKASLTDLLSLIGMYDIPFKFRTEFLSREAVGNSSVEKKNKLVDDSAKVCDVYKQMEKQSNDIKNPDLVEEPLVFKPIDTNELLIDPNSIPDFKMP